MGKANRERRRAKERARQQDRQRRQAGRPWPGLRAGGPAPEASSLPPSQLAAALVTDATSARSNMDDVAFRRCVAQLAERPHVPGWWRITEVALTVALESGVTAAWRAGWQPADVVRAVGRDLGGGRRTCRWRRDRGGDARLRRRDG